MVLKTRWTLQAGLQGLGLGLGLLLFGAPAPAATITIACGSNGQDHASCKRHTDDWARKTGHTVKLYVTPSSTTDLLGVFRKMFAAASPEIDVVMVDVVWPGLIKEHLVDLKKYSKGAEYFHFQAIVRNNTQEGKLLAMPWFTDAGLLFYRKDLIAKYGLRPPKTWDELALVAQKIQKGERTAGAADFQGFVFQAKAYEGLSCDALEWLNAFDGGSVVDAKGAITVNNPHAVKALQTAASWVGTIAPAQVLNYGEEDARGVFQSGKAAFMRNWPYAWSMGNSADSPIKGKIGVSPLPSAVAGGPRGATLGGWQLAVSKYSKNVDAAADLVMYLTSAAVQKERSIQGSYNPTLRSLYSDREVLQANPFLDELYKVFQAASPRPSTVTGLKYPEVSESFWNATHEVLSGKATAQDSLRRLEARLQQIKRGAW